MTLQDRWPVQFFEFVRPNGVKESRSIDRPAIIYQKFKQLRYRGIELHIEQLSTGEISMTATDMTNDELPIVHRIFFNSARNVEMFDGVINEAYLKICDGAV